VVLDETTATQGESLSVSGATGASVEEMVGQIQPRRREAVAHVPTEMEKGSSASSCVIQRSDSSSSAMRCHDGASPSIMHTCAPMERGDGGR
jgi:hypothetical protein